MEQYIKVKELSVLTGVSVRTLQYYDEIDLLKPAYTNEYGHRFYDANSFSKIFVIILLKNMGMSLKDIDQYVNHNDFDVGLFIKEEMQRIEQTITDLQLRLMRLSKLDEQVSKNENITPYLLSFFSQMTNEASITSIQLDKLAQNKEGNAHFNLKEWHTFINDLNECVQQQLPMQHNKTIACIRYWQENIIEANQVSEDMIEYAEQYYQTTPTNTFGMTAANYQYLVAMMKQYSEEQ